MSNIFNLDMQIDENYIKQSVEDIVKAGIVSALGDPSQIIQAAIGKTLNERVDRNGKPTTRTYDSKRYLDYVVEKAVSETAMEVVKAEIDNNRSKIKDALIKKMRNGKWLDAYVESLLTQTADSISNCWRTNIEVKFEAPKQEY